MQGQNYNPYTGAPLSGIDPPAGYPQKKPYRSRTVRHADGHIRRAQFLPLQYTARTDPDFGRYARRASHLRSFHSCRVGLEPC